MQKSSGLRARARFLSEKGGDVQEKAGTVRGIRARIPMRHTPCTVFHAQRAIGALQGFIDFWAV
jgi:hypothetical protein